MSAEATKVKSYIALKNIVFALLLLVAVGLSGWNGVAATALSRQQRVTQSVQDELDAIRLEHKAFKELEEKRKAAIFLLEARRNAALQQLERNTQQAERMMSICESPEEIIPIFSDLIQSVNSHVGKNREVKFYVPPGDHALVVRWKFVKGGDFNDIITDEGMGEADFKEQFLKLKRWECILRDSGVE